MRTRSLDALLPILHLRGTSMGDFGDVLAALLGKDAPNLSPSVVARLRGEWEADYSAGSGATFGVVSLIATLALYADLGRR